MKKISKKIILILVLVTMLLVLGVTYAFFEEIINGEKTEIVTGQIYMDYKENSQISLKDMLPETKEEALKRNDDNGVFNFTITGRNTSKHPIYYGISLANGDVPEGKTTLLKPEHIMIYLERDGEVLIDGIRYSNWDNQRIWVETIDAGTKENVDYNYTLRMWIDTEIMVSDTNPNRDYTVEEWNNAYASLKVNVNGNIETMNMPLSIETSDTFVENNNAYFIAKISNFYDINDLGKTLDTTDNIKFQVTGTNSDMGFSYKDSEGNVVAETSETLDLTYLFNKNKTVEVQVFVKPKNDVNGVTDLTLRLIKNGVTIQDFHKRMNVYGNNFCLNNGLNKLYDCILASDSLTTNVETAKVNIANKGEPNLNDTAPSYTYVEEFESDVSNVLTVDGRLFYFADSYSFDATSGNFTVENSDGSKVITDYLSDKYRNYYSCGPTLKCSEIYYIKSTLINGSIQTITFADRIKSKISSTIRSEVGLYKAEDDYGDIYFYRGDVDNNNVYFGGYYWKIIRTNGDNSIRLIYNGDVSNASVNKTSINNKRYPYGIIYPETNSPLGVRTIDPTYVGYMYGKNFSKQTSELFKYELSAPLTEYYFADGYEFDDVNEVFKLKKIKLDMVSGTFSSVKDSFSSYPYTCLGTTDTDVCEAIFKVDSMDKENVVNVQYISFSSTNKDGTRNNEYSSNAKVQIEKWYETNLDKKYDNNDNLITDYIVDGTFCNDRSSTHSIHNSGYLLNKTTYYSSYSRLIFNSSKSAILKCNADIRDQFSDTSSRGNGLLDFPVALITIDEVALAGGKFGFANKDFYLRSGGTYWTMTPSYFNSDKSRSVVWQVIAEGNIYSWNTLANEAGLRPVINIRSDVLIASGDGTTENPFTLKLA